MFCHNQSWLRSIEKRRSRRKGGGGWQRNNCSTEVTFNVNVCFPFHLGPCGSVATPKPCPQSCPDKSRPVCATDGKTYRNGCFLSVAKCRLPREEKRKLKLKYQGQCGAPRVPCLLHKCTVKRNKKPRQVCGTDGKTYKSKCHLRAAKCNRKAKRGRPLTIKKWGKCDRMVRVPSKPLD